MSLTKDYKDLDIDIRAASLNAVVYTFKELYHKALEDALGDTPIHIAYPSGDVLLYVNRPMYVSGILSVGVKLSFSMVGTIPATEVAKYVETVLQPWSPINVRVEGRSIRMEFQPTPELRDLLPHTRPKPYEDIRTRMDEGADFDDILKDFENEDQTNPTQ